MNINPHEFVFGLGDEVKDEVTGFKGIVTGRHQWLNNCNTYSVQPTTLKDGAPQERVAFDEPQLILIKAHKIKGQKPEEKTGGPERKVSQPNRI